MSEVVETIRARERTLVAAILNGDLATVDAVIAPEFVYTASEIGRRTRDEWLDGISTYRIDVFEIIEMSIEPFGDSAVVQACIRQKANIHGHEREGLFLLTDVWIRQHDTWRLVTRTSIADKQEFGEVPRSN